MAVQLTDAGRMVAHAYTKGAGNTTKASAGARAAPRRSLQGNIFSGITSGIESGANAVKNAAVGTAESTFPGVSSALGGNFNIDAWMRDPTVNLFTGGASALGSAVAHPGRTAGALTNDASAALFGPAGAVIGNYLNPGAAVTKFLTDAGHTVLSGLGLGGGSPKAPAKVVKNPKPVVLGTGTNTGGGGTGGGSTTLPAGPDATGAVMKGLGSESLVPQPTYQTVPTVGYTPVSASNINPYSFDIPGQAIPQIDLNGLPTVGVPQMSADDATAAGKLLSTGLNLQNLDWAALMKGAGSIAAAQYGPQVQSIINQARNSANTIQGYTSGAQTVLGNTANKVGQTYQNAIAQQTALDQGIHNMLASSNPTAAETPQMNALGIDPTTQAQIAAQNTESFNTTGGVLGSLGQLNANSLNAQSAAVQSYVRSLPAQIALGGQQALGNVATGLSSSLATVATQEAKDAWQMAKDMGASDQKAGTAYQNAYNTTMNNWFKFTGQSLSAQKANQATGLSAAKTNVGTVTSILKGNQATAAGIEKINLSNDTRVDIANQGAALSAGKANQSAIVSNNYHNAQIYMEGVKTSISSQNADTNRGKLALALWKAENPTATATQSSTAAKAARDFFSKSAGYVPMGYTTQSRYNQNTGTTATVRVPTYSQMTYAQMIDNYTQSNGGTPQAQSFAINMANSYVNPGYRGRPLDPEMVDVLSKAGIDPTIQTTGKGIPYLTSAQAVALNNGGFASFAHYLSQGTIQHDDGSKERVFVIPPLKGGG